MYIFIAIPFQWPKHLSYILREYYFEIKDKTRRCTDKSSNEGTRMFITTQNSKK